MTEGWGGGPGVKRPGRCVFGRANHRGTETQRRQHRARRKGEEKTSPKRQRGNAGPSLALRAGLAFSFLPILRLCLLYVSVPLWLVPFHPGKRRSRLTISTAVTAAS